MQRPEDPEDKEQQFTYVPWFLCQSHLEPAQGLWTFLLVVLQLEGIILIMPADQAKVVPKTELFQKESGPD